ncbi:MAG TPA: hypothetical protein VF669_05675, partial [Tepidisphaeraceae bacterium]
GGKLVVVDLLPHDREDFRRQMGQRHAGFSHEEMVQLMKGAGLERGVRVVGLEPEPGVKGPALFLAVGGK